MFISQWLGTEIKPRICQLPVHYFLGAYLKVHVKLPPKTEKSGSAHAGSRDYEPSKIESEKSLAAFLSVIALSRIILLITNKFLIKLDTLLWFPNFEILFRSRVIAYESLF